MNITTLATSACVWLASAAGAEQSQPDEPFFSSIVQLTSHEQFSRAGEAYFSPDSGWIIFQAVPHAEETGGQPRYSMYVAPIMRDPSATVTGLGEAIRISEPGSANTCGWFHPTLPGVVMFGSTTTPPSKQVDAGFSRGSSRYTWDFPAEMEVVTRTIRPIVEQSVTNPTLRQELLSRPDVERAIPMWTRDGYDAEGSWSPDGRLVLYTAVDPATRDGDIFVFDIASGTSTPLVVAPGYDGGPFFSPDGKRICYRSDRNGNNLLQLFVSELEFDHRGVPVGVSREIQLTDNSHVNWAPFWHPSGDYLVYATSEVSHLNYEVFAVPSEQRGSGMPATVRITNAEGFDGLPVFNQDASLMMWTGQRGEVDEHGGRSSQLYAATMTRHAPAGLDLSGASGTITAQSAPVSDALTRVTPDARRFHEHVTVLASPWLAGRLPGTRGIQVAEEYIEHWFELHGLAPAIQTAKGMSYFQTFEFKRPEQQQPIVGRNVVARLEGKGPLADRFIIIGAHHDHLGHGEHSSMSGSSEVHEGADDNASGVAAVLLLAEDLGQQYRTMPDARSILFVTFSAEEMGLNGSRAFVESSPVELERCDLMLNIDMIGRVTDGRVSVSGLGSAEGLSDILADALSATDLTVIRPDGLSARSDHAAFYDAKRPVLFMSIDPFHADYHTPNDESWKINSHGASMAVDLARSMVLSIATTPSPLAFAEVAAYDRGPSVGRGGLQVRFGIMPGNYNDSEPGIDVQRVSPGGSAETGGILAGDRLMEWNGTTIESVSHWMELMAEHTPGDVVTVTVTRNGDRVDVPVTLQASAKRE